MACKATDTSGFCYDPAGTCDGTTACCAPGQTCFDLMSILMGGLGGTGLPSGGGTPALTACSCSTAADCLGGEMCNPSSAICAIPLIGLTVCPTGTPPSSMPASLCYDFTKLLAGLPGDQATTPEVADFAEPSPEQPDP